MIKGSIQEEDITLININAPSIGALKYIKQIQRDTDSRRASKLLEENINKTFSDINCSDIFLDQSSKAKEKKSRNKQMVPSQIFCTAEEIINKTKRQPPECKKIFANDVTDKGLISKIYQQLI